LGSGGAVSICAIGGGSTGASRTMVSLPSARRISAASCSLVACHEMSRNIPAARAMVRNAAFFAAFCASAPGENSPCGANQHRHCQPSRAAREKRLDGERREQG
jgi:hypothetical protein